MTDLAILIVSYNTRELLNECLQSIFASQGDFTYRVCVIDNQSQDASADMVRRQFPQVHLIASSHNGGYAYANNLGLRHFGFGASDRARNNAFPRYVLLLNPDTQLPPMALAEMLAFMDERPAVGAAGPRLVRPDGSLDLACRRSFPTPEVSLWRMTGLSKLFPASRRFGRYNMTYLSPDVTTEVDSVVGAFMLVRREAILQAGLLDESFFMYGEDLDWAYRIKQRGWQIWYNADVTVLHHKEASSKRSRKARIEFYRAMVIFYRKHYEATTPFWLHWLILGGIALKGGLDISAHVLRARPDVTGGRL